MKCPECGKEMKAQNYYKKGRVRLKAKPGEYFWCSNCDTEIIHYTMMKKLEREENRYV